jgi:nicotinate phosphoribosyltransferase
MSMQIIESLLDNDYYNFTMGQLIWKYFPGVTVTYRFMCRTDQARLGQLIDIDELNSQLDSVRILHLSEEEQDYLRSLGPLSAEYVAFLSQLQLPKVTARQVGDDLEIEYCGLWDSAIFWETPILAIVSELVTRMRSRGNEDSIAAEGERRLEEKIATWRDHPSVRAIEYGTRRRASRANQKRVYQALLEAIPCQLLGTSNVSLAREFGTSPSGTMAHQLFMVVTAIKDDAGDSHPIASAQKLVLDLYEELYGAFENGRLLTFLPDTFGTETALTLFEDDRALRWHGLRQDSGDPFEIGRLMEDFWLRHGIDPKTRIFSPSDGLNLDQMIALEAEFGGRMQTIFGIGTNLTNDVGLPVTSNVIKPVYVTLSNRRVPTVKLSDNIAKATGDRDMIERRKAEAGYHVTYRMAATY